MILKTYEYKGFNITWEKHPAAVSVSNGMFGLESFGFYVNSVKYSTLDDAKIAIDNMKA